MPKSQKGRHTAAIQIEELPRRKNVIKDREARGRQQFGGVAQRTDRDIDHLSRRARLGILTQIVRRRTG